MLFRILFALFAMYASDDRYECNCLRFAVKRLLWRTLFKNVRVSLDHSRGLGGLIEHRDGTIKCPVGFAVFVILLSVKRWNFRVECFLVSFPEKLKRAAVLSIGAAAGNGLICEDVFIPKHSSESNDERTLSRLSRTRTR